MTEIDVSSKGITDLTGVEFFTALNYLYCHYHQLTSLDLTKNTELEYLYCANNPLLALNVATSMLAAAAMVLFGIYEVVKSRKAADRRR